MSSVETPAFIDFEASSLDLIASYPIEVGVTLPDSRLASWLIRPHVLWQDWSASAEAVHGIAREQLQSEGEDVADVARSLNESLNGTVYCDAWTFDSFWLHRLYRAANLTPTFHLESVAAILAPDQIQRWPQIRQIVIEELALPMHRAANDARILQETWRRVTAATGQ